MNMLENIEEDTCGASPSSRRRTPGVNATAAARRQHVTSTRSHRRRLHRRWRLTTLFSCRRDMKLRSVRYIQRWPASPSCSWWTWAATELCAHSVLHAGLPRHLPTTMSTRTSLTATATATKKPTSMDDLTRRPSIFRRQNSPRVVAATTRTSTSTFHTRLVGRATQFFFEKTNSLPICLERLRKRIDLSKSSRRLASTLSSATFPPSPTTANSGVALHEQLKC